MILARGLGKGGPVVTGGLGYGFFATFVSTLPAKMVTVLLEPARASLALVQRVIVQVWPTRKDIDL